VWIFAGGGEAEIRGWATLLPAQLTGKRVKFQNTLPQMQRKASSRST